MVDITQKNDNSNWNEKNINNQNTEVGGNLKKWKFMKTYKTK